jgi:hypothetical protein
MSLDAPSPNCRTNHNGSHISASLLFAPARGNVFHLLLPDTVLAQWSRMISLRWWRSVLERSTSALCIRKRRARWRSPAVAVSNYRLCVAHGAADDARVGVKWGQSTQNSLHAMWLQHPRIQDFLGQVGQESNLQPAVLEPAAVASGMFKEVHEHAGNGPF